MKLSKNQKGFNDVITITSIAGISGSLFITGIFIWKEVEIFNITNKVAQLVDKVVDVDNEERAEVDNYLKIIGDSVIIPTFEIELDLSSKAEEKLKSDNESIIISFAFYGEPNDNINKQDFRFTKGDELILVSNRIELFNERIAKFENIKFPKNMYDTLFSRDIILWVNVFSGRRSSDKNILMVDALQHKMSTLLNKDNKIILTGKLIGE